MTAPADLAARIARAREAVAKATPGPWEAAGLGIDGQIPAVIFNEPDSSDWLPVCYFADSRGDGRAADLDENRALIVLAVNALPALLDVAEAAKVFRSAETIAAWVAAGDALDAALDKVKEVLP